MSDSRSLVARLDDKDHTFGVYAGDSLVMQRYTSDFYDTQRIIQKQMEDLAKKEARDKIEVENTLYNQTHYTGDVLQRDTNFPIVHRVPVSRDPRKMQDALYPKEGVEFQRPPLDEGEWGKDAEYFFQSREGRNNRPMQTFMQPFHPL
jgi:hypothetical protein